MSKFFIGTPQKISEGVYVFELSENRIGISQKIGSVIVNIPSNKVRVSVVADKMSERDKDEMMEQAAAQVLAVEGMSADEIVKKYNLK